MAFGRLRGAPWNIFFTSLTVNTNEALATDFEAVRAFGGVPRVCDGGTCETITDIDGLRV